MPLTRESNLKHAYGKLLSEQYIWNRQAHALNSSPESGYTSTSSSSPESLYLSSSPCVLLEAPRRRVGISETVQHRYSADFEDFEESNCRDQSEARDSEGDSYLVTFLKVFLCVICPLIVLGVCAMLFKSASCPNCPCSEEEMPPTSPMMEDFSPYHQNYEDHHHDYDF